MSGLRPPPTLRRFLRSNAFVRIAVGPVGSGKSTACVLEIMRRAGAQEPGADGVRRTRWAVIRNTYPELRDTTRKTFEEWVPTAKEPGAWQEREFSFTLNRAMTDGTEIHCEVLFRALDRPGDIKKLLSLELTGAYINECREIPKQVFDVLQSRVGRYPRQADGGPTWFGIWADTNPWHTQHWLAALARQNLPGYDVYRQPSGRAPSAENVENLPTGYYGRLIAGKDSEWVKVYVDGEDAASVVGSIWGEALAALGPPKAFEHSSDGVFTSWDLGRSDSTAIWFWRVAGAKVEVIDHCENHLKPLSHYFDIVDCRGYEYVKHWLPHDARAKTLASSVSVEEQMRERWPGKVEIGPNLSVADGLAAGRWLLEGRCVFHSRCAVGLDALAAYRREYDEEARAYGTTPVHDWSSHTADAFRYLAVVAKHTGRIMQPKAPPAEGPLAVPLSGSFTLDQLFDLNERGDSRRRRV